MEDLGELGFWLAAGMVVAALILAHGQKEREKERQKQETLRALLTADGKNTSEILAYMRESDAADQKREDEQRVAEKISTRKALAVVAALIVGIITLLGTVFIITRIGAGDPSTALAIGLVFFGPLTLAGLIAFFVYILIRGKKNVPPPGA